MVPLKPFPLKQPHPVICKRSHPPGLWASLSLSSYSPIRSFSRPFILCCIAAQPFGKMQTCPTHLGASARCWGKALAGLPTSSLLWIASMNCILQRKTERDYLAKKNVSDLKLIDKRKHLSVRRKTLQPSNQENSTLQDCNFCKAVSSQPFTKGRKSHHFPSHHASGFVPFAAAETWLEWYHVRSLWIENGWKWIFSFPKFQNLPYWNSKVFFGGE